MTPSGTAHIFLDDRGRAWIDDTNVKVIEVVKDKLHGGMSPKDIDEEFPDLSLAQIHAALSYYYDHKAAFDAQIEEDDRFVQEMMGKTANSPFRLRLRELKEKRS